METIRLEIPRMFGDHHVMAVRRIVSALPGVTAVSASAAWHRLEVSFEPGQLSPETLQTALAQQGYPPGTAPTEHQAYASELQHSVAIEHKDLASKTDFAAPALGACPGLEPRIVAGEHPADR